MEVPGPRKSVGAEVNYGIRFESLVAAHRLLDELSQEVERRMNLAAAKGRTVTLKLKRYARPRGLSLLPELPPLM